MSLNVSFHNPQLVQVKVVDSTLTTLDIYDNDLPYGTRVTLYFDSAVDIANWAEQIMNKALAANDNYRFKEVGV